MNFYCNHNRIPGNISHKIPKISLVEFCSKDKCAKKISIIFEEIPSLMLEKVSGRVLDGNLVETHRETSERNLRGIPKGNLEKAWTQTFYISQKKIPGIIR